MIRFIARACGLALTVLVTVSPAQAEFKVGVAVVEITPMLCDDAAANARPNQFDAERGCFRWIHLAGFSPYIPFRDDNRLAEGVHDPLWSRALAIEGANGEAVVLVATDLPGLSSKHTSHIRRRVALNHSIPRSNIIIHSTHTHSAPDGSGYWSTLMRGHNKHYTDYLRDRIYASIDQALRNLQPATMKVATTTHLACHNPRTRQLKKEPNCRLPNINNEFNTSTADYDEFLIQRDQRDPIVGNTRIVTAEFTTVDGDPIATFVNWHNHPDTLGSANRLISSDYPHYLRDFMEHARGGRSVYFVGTVGNQIGGLRNTPVPLWDDARQRVFEEDTSGLSRRMLVTEGWDKIRSTGYEIGAEAAAALAAAAATDDTEIMVTVRSRMLETPVDNFIHLLATWSVWHHDVAYEDRLRYHWPRCWGLLGCVLSEVSLVRVGDLTILTAPGEIDPAYVLGRQTSTANYGPKWGSWHFPAMAGIDQYMPGKHHAVVGSTHDYLSYMIPVSDYVGWWNGDHPNHYEDLVTIGRRFGNDVERAWLKLLDAELIGSAQSVP